MKKRPYRKPSPAILALRAEEQAATLAELRRTMEALGLSVPEMAHRLGMARREDLDPVLRGARRLPARYEAALEAMRAEVDSQTQKDEQ